VTVAAAAGYFVFITDVFNSSEQSITPERIKPKIEHLITKKKTLSLILFTPVLAKNLFVSGVRPVEKAEIKRNARLRRDFDFLAFSPTR
jgi:hypothetical protein